MSKNTYSTSFMFLDKPDFSCVGVSRSTLDDSRITELISQNVMNFLYYPCNADEIRARQAIFKELDNKGEFYNRIISLKSALVTLDACDRSMHMAIAGAPKVFKTVKLLEAFLVCVGKITELESQSELIKHATDLWKIDNKEYIDGIKGDVARARELLSTIGYINFRLDRRGYMLSVEENCDNYVDMLKKIGDDFGVKMSDKSELSIKIDSAMSEGIEKFFPEVFRFLHEIEEKYASLPVDEIYAVKSEIDFYLEILELCRRAGENGIPHSYPEVFGKRGFVARDAYDISLMHKKSEKIIPNDIRFEDDSLFCFLTGANGGGKTTYLRAVAINLILSIAGAPVFCESAKVYPYRSVVTHFPADERFGDSGRLVDEQKRIDSMLDAADGDSFLLFNETFSGTDDVKGCRLTLDAVQKLKDKNASGLFVTHFHEVSKAGLPMLGTVVDEKNLNARTFKIVIKKGGINSSYANDILRKYMLDRESIDKRISEIGGNNSNEDKLSV